MTAVRTTGKARRETVALTRSQVESIVRDMGWEPEDADAFWSLAVREAAEPGSLDREARAYFERLALHMDGGRP
ncbi:MAG: hypothetical protein IT539_01390 [Bradyrhizobiaceae bacterium]|nr:hypothetical protein [Bradyrhizobiaceae bacterium]